MNDGLRETISRFYSSKAFAVVGVSTNKRKFGNIVYRAMKERGFTVYPVHPTLPDVEGETCFHSVMDLPEQVKSIVTVVPPKVTEVVVSDCVRKGIRTVWMQQGSESDDAIDIARKYDIAVVHGQCLLMFLEPVGSVHAVHRWFKKMVGAYPG